MTLKGRRSQLCESTATHPELAAEQLPPYLFRGFSLTWEILQTEELHTVHRVTKSRTRLKPPPQVPEKPFTQVSLSQNPSNLDF